MDRPTPHGDHHSNDIPQHLTVAVLTVQRDRTAAVPFVIAADPGTHILCDSGDYRAAGGETNRSTTDCGDDDEEFDTASEAAGKLREIVARVKPAP